MFHLGWFLGPGITVQGWNTPGFSRGYEWTKPDIYQDAVKALERAKFDLDEPVGEIKTNGMQTMLKMFQKHGPDASLRKILTAPNEFTAMIGTADSVAGSMQETMEEVGGDGFLITGHFKPKYVTSIVDELVPALQKRQLTRTEYGGETFRDNLMAF